MDHQGAGRTRRAADTRRHAESRYSPRALEARVAELYRRLMLDASR